MSDRFGAAVKRSAIACVVTVLGLAGSALEQVAFAGLVEIDWKVSGDRALLQDTDTGITWLDLRLSFGLSYLDISAKLGSGGDFEGFRFATRSEIVKLFSDAGIPDIDVAHGGTAANVPGVPDLMAKWDAVLQHTVQGNFGYFLTAEVPRPGYHDSGLLWLPNNGLAEATSGTTSFRPGEQLDVFASVRAGALVLASSVPEPASITLFGLGLAMVALLRRASAAPVQSSPRQRRFSQRRIWRSVRAT
jgi:hypothetical protein